MYQVLAVIVIVIWLMVFVPLIVIGTRSQRKAPFISAVFMGLVVGGCVGTFCGLVFAFGDNGVDFSRIPGSSLMAPLTVPVVLGGMLGALIGAYIGGGIAAASPAAREPGGN